MDPPVQIGQYILGKNLGIGAFGKVSAEKMDISYRLSTGWCQPPLAADWVTKCMFVKHTVSFYR
jgi:hypothetical protein